MMRLRFIVASVLMGVAASVSPALAACGPGKAPTYNDIDAVWYERTGCFGKCPSYQVLFTNSGDCYYVGFANIPKAGTYGQTCSADTLERARIALQRHAFYRLEYDSARLVLDVPHYIVAVRRCGVTTKLDWPAHEDWKDFEVLLDSLDAITGQVRWHKISNSTAPMESWEVMP